MKKNLLERCEVELIIRGYSKRTVKSYTTCIKKYLRFVGEDVPSFSEERIKDFLVYKKRQNCAPKTLHVYLSAVKFLYRKVLGVWHKIDIKFAKRNVRNPVVLSHQKIMDLIGTYQNLKHKILVALAYGTGLRVSEVTNLKIRDLDFYQNLINVRQGKGAKDRVTLLPDVLVDDLKGLINDRSFNDYVFESQLGGKLSTRTLQKIFQNGLRRANIQEKATFHSLRHSFATHLLDGGVQLCYIQKLLGHSNIRTTQIYTKVSIGAIKAIKSPL